MLARVIRRYSAALFAGSVMILGGCTLDSAGPATNPLTSEPAFAVSSSAQALVYSSQDDPRLLAWLQSEQGRLAQAQLASQVPAVAPTGLGGLLKATLNSVLSILYCDPLPYAAATRIVGPKGGAVGFGPHKLTIAAGALKGYTVITAEAPSNRAIQAKFAPHGLQFAVQSSLELSYKHCKRPLNLTTRIVYVDDLGKILEKLLSLGKNNNGIAQGWIKHFSSYMVAF